jgi:beta-galactosidase
MKRLSVFIIVIQLLVLYSCTHSGKRETVSLNGTWKIAEGSMDKAPGVYNHSIQVPGLVSLAVPAFRDPGPRVKDRGNLIQKDTLREAFWYCRKFRIDEQIPAVAMLKVAKAMYGTKVILNGRDMGEHLPCFTPGWFNVKGALQKGENELLIRVGSSRSSIPRSVPDGFDFEKERYIPGIFDNVQLIMCSAPEIVNVQTAPEISKHQVRVQVRLGPAPQLKKSAVTFVVKEAKSQKTVARLVREFKFPAGIKDEAIIDVSLPISGCRLWSPEDPFLYNLIVTTEGDECQTRFGMREFRLDTISGRTLLNGKPYFMRGSNVTLYRFFEDDSCRALPWNTEWIRKLHQSFKKFHWNGLRYCIGIAPEKWYDIADEEGILIQNEFPVWYGGKGWCVWPPELKSSELAGEYREWIMDQWNHPSIVIWDASNETLSNDGKNEEVADAVKAVRGLDLSHRPWDNSYSPVRETGDVLELHPYHFYNAGFRLMDIDTVSKNPGGDPDDKRYIRIVNEYGWLWLNRDGSPTTLTKDLYRNLLGVNSTTEQRRHVYASYLAAETEFWRCHRECTAVLHFTTLGYSRSDGQTSDHFTNVKDLIYEGEFMKYMPDAFSPAGLMLDEWGKEIETGILHNFRIIAINDLEPEWKGSIVLRIMDHDKPVSEKSQEILIPSYGESNAVLTLDTPPSPGVYRVIASLENANDKPVKSIREIRFVKK